MVLEVCAYSLTSCAIAVRGGAQRLEFCATAGVGGTTPHLQDVQSVLEWGIPVFPMVRPRGGNFVYNVEERKVIEQSIQVFRELGCPGIAVGAACNDGQLDGEFMYRIIEAAGPMAVTCHKVFDGVPDPFEALETLVQCGCKRVLTSGLATDAMHGAELIRQLVGQANGRIIVMPGGGVRSTNILELARITGATEFHSSAIPAEQGSTVADEAEVRALALELRCLVR